MTTAPAGASVRLQSPAQVGDVGLERPHRARRRGAGPQLVDDAVNGDDSAGVEQEDPEEGALLRAAEVHPLAGADDLQLPEDPVLQEAPSGPSRTAAATGRKRRAYLLLVTP